MTCSVSFGQNGNLGTPPYTTPWLFCLPADENRNTQYAHTRLARPRAHFRNYARAQQIRLSPLPSRRPGRGTATSLRRLTRPLRRVPLFVDAVEIVHRPVIRWRLRLTYSRGFGSCTRGNAFDVIVRLTFSRGFGSCTRGNAFELILIRRYILVPRYSFCSSSVRLHIRASPVLGTNIDACVRERSARA